MILLHDMAQGHDCWPNIWNGERWDAFDIGIVPGNDWADRWAMCSFEKYATPRLGVYNPGYPKGDYVNDRTIIERASNMREELQMRYKYTVLYAPSWENDEKEDDFVRALQTMEVNLLIKQAHWPKEYSHITHNINQMRKMHEGKYGNVYYLEPEENILVALCMCDLVVSDESSVMTEALLFGKPSIAVYGWLIPDTVPSRFASVPFDTVDKCIKVELREKTEQIVNKLEKNFKTTNKEKKFSNIGNCNSDILDLVGYLIGESEECECLKREVQPQYMLNCFWNI